MTCPCGSGKNYSSCCGRFHDGLALPQTAEEMNGKPTVLHEVSIFKQHKGRWMYLDGKCTWN